MTNWICNNCGPFQTEIATRINWSQKIWNVVFYRTFIELYRGRDGKIFKNELSDV